MKLTPVRILMAVATIVTAAIHLFVGLNSFGFSVQFAILFILNGISYLVLLAGVLTDVVPVLSANKSLARYALIGFAALTFVLYFVVNGFSDIGATAVIAKAAEIVVIVTALIDSRA